MQNKTKIVATLGPASAKRGELRLMMQAGASVFRVNGAHGSPEEHKKTISLVRDVSRNLGVPAAILMDLPGPKYRIGRLAKEPVNLKAGDVVTLACGQRVQRNDSIPVPHNIAGNLRPGSKIFINDGIVSLSVSRVEGRRVHARVKTGGEIRSFKGLNLPGTKLTSAALTAEDKRILESAIRNGVDFVGLSFVRTRSNILALRRLLAKRAPHIGIVAKIEKPEALEDLDGIVDAADAVMVARGDLGIEMPFDQVPLLQRRILRACINAGKPAITATQMMESMVIASRPTRAEATDVAGAVWEGTDAVMLSEETSIGKNPATAVLAMARIALQAERAMLPLPGPACPADPASFQAHVLSEAAAFVAENMEASAIVAPTRSGRTPLSISRGRPSVPVLAPTEDERTARRMCLYWGVRPMAMKAASTVDETLRQAERAALKSRLIKKGDTIVIASGAHGRKGGITRLVEVRKI